MTRITRTAIALTFGMMALGVAVGDAQAQGLFGVGDMAVGGSGMMGDRQGGGGFGLSAHFELGTMFEMTALGNWMGMEIQTEVGYESYASSEFLFDVGMGFPITLLQIGNGGPGTTLFTFALGGGMSVQHMYAYVRGRILTQISASTYIELMARWTPPEASNTWTDDDEGLDILHLRASAFFAIAEDDHLQLFAEWAPADVARGGQEDPNDLARFPDSIRSDYQSVVRVGVGYVW